MRPETENLLWDVVDSLIINPIKTGVDKFAEYGCAHPGLVCFKAFWIGVYLLKWCMPILAVFSFFKGVLVMIGIIIGGFVLATFSTKLMFMTLVPLYHKITKSRKDYLERRRS